MNNRHWARPVAVCILLQTIGCYLDRQSDRQTVDPGLCHKLLPPTHHHYRNNVWCNYHRPVLCKMSHTHYLLTYHATALHSTINTCHMPQRILYYVRNKSCGTVFVCVCVSVRNFIVSKALLLCIEFKEIHLFSLFFSSDIYLTIHWEKSPVDIRVCVFNKGADIYNTLTVRLFCILKLKNMDSPKALIRPLK